MYLFAHNLLLGHAKPGCRKDERFFDFCLDRFQLLLERAEEQGASLVLSGKSLSSMKLEHWLRVIELLKEYEVKLYLILPSRPSDDLVAMHNAGHLTVVGQNQKRQLNAVDEMCFSSDVLNFTVNNCLFSYDTITCNFTMTTQKGEESTTLHSIIQCDENQPRYVIVTKGVTAASFETVQLEDESHLVLMDYVEALKSNSIVNNESVFIELLSKSTTNSNDVTIESCIRNLNAPDDVANYLLQLSKRAELFDELA